MTLAIAFPNIDPVIFSIGPLSIRWYALSYIAGLLIGIKYIGYFVSKAPYAMDRKNTEDLLVWLTLGVILGGRLGYVLFYNIEFYLNNPIAVFKVWEGGMAFHGGLIGVISAIIIFCRQRKLNILAVSDAVACAAPIGLFFGRIANFINGELIGRITDVPWAVIFPGAGRVPRHPSQLYEAALEGLFLFAVLNILWRSLWFRNRPGFISGIFVAGYGLLRGIAEFYRQPDEHIGFLIYGSTIGQLLSLPMILLGIYLIASSKEEA